MAKKKKYGSTGKPSDKISSSKAKKMLRDNSAHGKPLTKKQKGMLGAAAGRKKK